MSKPLAIDLQLSEEPSSFLHGGSQIGEGASVSDPTLAALEVDNIARAIAEGSLSAQWALGVGAITRILGEARTEGQRGGSR